MPDDEWTKAERLAVAGIVAPRLRSQSERAAKRRVALVDKDGNVVRYTSLAEVQQAVLLQKKIELEVVEGRRQTAIVCEECGAVEKINTKARRQKRCRKCSFLRCEKCDVELPQCYSAPSFVKKRKGRPPLCKTCYAAGRERLPPPTCAVCGKELHRGRRARGQTTLRCRECVDRARREATEQKALCVACGKSLGRRAAYQGAKYHAACYTSELRRAAFEEKMKDPEFARKTAENLLKGRNKNRTVPHDG